jgi:hypothetical protein
LFTSCKKESITAEDPENGIEYFPIQEGKFISYTVDSTLYDDRGLTKVNTSSFIKMEIGKLLQETGDSKKYILNKYWKRESSSTWILTDVETITSKNSEIVVSEENLPIVKMIFPNNVGKTWKSTRLFDENIESFVLGETIKVYQGWNSEVIDKKSDLKVNNKEYNNVLEVIHANDKSSVNNLRFVKEFYAPNLGLIKREMKIYDTNNPVQGQAWETYVHKGFSITMQIFENN